VLYRSDLECLILEQLRHLAPEVAATQLSHNFNFLQGTEYLRTVQNNVETYGLRESYKGIYTLLDVFVERGNEMAVQWLVSDGEVGIKLSDLLFDGSGRFHPVSLGMAKVLLSNGASLEYRGCGRKTFLMIAASTHRTDLVGLFIDCGADVQARCNDGKTALQYAKKSETYDADQKAKRKECINMLKRAEKAISRKW
jgi:hypothetical protein